MNEHKWLSVSIGGLVISCLLLAFVAVTQIVQIHDLQHQIRRGEAAINGLADRVYRVEIHTEDAPLNIRIIQQATGDLQQRVGKLEAK